MQISLKGTNIQILESTRVYVDRKIVRTLEKLLKAEDQSVGLSVEVEKTTEHHNKGKIFRAEVTLAMGRNVLRAEALADTLNEAIDMVDGEIAGEIKKFKGKRRTEMLKGARKVRGK
jgi:ribosomal subunit interface protein